MRKIFFIALGVTLFSCNNKKEKKGDEMPKNNDLPVLNLKGKVQQTDETTISIDSTGASKSDSTVKVLIFDAKGYQIESYTKDAAGKHMAEEFVKRDSAGAVTEMTTMKNGKQAARLVTEIKDGKYVAAKNYDSADKEESYYTDVKTNDYGQVYEGTQHFLDGRVKSTFSSKFKGSIYIGGTGTDSTGKTDYSSTVTLDDNDNTISETVTTVEKGVSKTETSTFKYELDDKGNWTQRTTINDKGKTTKITKRVITYFKD